MNVKKFANKKIVVCAALIARRTHWWCEGLWQVLVW